MPAKLRSDALKSTSINGRPTKYRPEYAEQAYKLCLAGAISDDLATAFGVVPTTIDNWLADIEEFHAAVHAGKEGADDKVEQSLWRRATGYEHKAVKIFHNGPDKEPTIVEYVERYPPDTGAMAFWLKNRRRGLWKDSHDITHVVDDQRQAFTAAISQMPADQLAQLRAAVSLLLPPSDDAMIDVTPRRGAN